MSRHERIGLGSAFWVLAVLLLIETSKADLILLIPLVEAAVSLVIGGILFASVDQIKKESS